MSLIYYPDDNLRKISTAVEDNEDVSDLILTMQQTMKKHVGIGLAAVQINVHKRIFVMNDQVFINPVIVSLSKDLSQYSEGCLSIKNFRYSLLRPSTVEIEFLDQNRNKKCEFYNGINARCIQHEMEHLDGRLFIDNIEGFGNEN